MFSKIQLVLLGMVLWASCSQSGSKEDVIYIGLSPSADAERTNHKIEVITQYFSDQLGVPVKHVLVTNPNAMIEAMRAKKIHIGSGGPFTYLVAAEKAGADAIITTQVAEGTEDLYRTIFITQKNSPINNLEDLKKHASQTTLSWAYPTSCSGHLVPRYVLQQEGIYPEDFKEVFTSTNHTSAIFTAISGKVDVAAVYKSGVHRFTEEGRISKDDYKIIWESGPLLASPAFVRKDLGSDFKEKVRHAYLNMKTLSPETWKVLRGQYSFDIEYVAIDDSDFDHYRLMANEINGLGFNFNLNNASTNQ